MRHDNLVWYSWQIRYIRKKEKKRNNLLARASRVGGKTSKTDDTLINNKSSTREYISLNSKFHTIFTQYKKHEKIKNDKENQQTRKKLEINYVQMDGFSRANGIRLCRTSAPKLKKKNRLNNDTYIFGKILKVDGMSFEWSIIK